MNITVSINDGTKESIIQIDQRQEIAAGLRILQETGRSSYRGEPSFFRSAARQEVVSAYCSFEELGIFSGDVLTVVEEKETTDPQEEGGK